MIEFQYSRATDVADALRQIADNPSAKFVAGGTNLIDLMKMDVERPTKVIDITRLPLKQVEDTSDGGLRIGALVRNSDLAYHAPIEQRYPVLASAILAGASQQLRNMATTGPPARSPGPTSSPCRSHAATRPCLSVSCAASQLLNVEVGKRGCAPRPWICVPRSRLRPDTQPHVRLRQRGRG